MRILRIRNALSISLFLGITANVAFGQRLEDQRVEHSNFQNFDRFGHSVAMDGQIAVVGAPDLPDSNGARVGSAYVYRYSPFTESWVFEAELIHPRPVNLDRYGESVAVSGDRIVIGAPDIVNAGGSRVGAAFVWRYDPIVRVWLFEQELNHNRQIGFDEFGCSVAIDGETIAVGAYNIPDQIGHRTGAVFVFDYKGSAWSQTQEVADPRSVNWAEFGTSVSLSNGRLAVGAPNTTVQGTRVGAVFSFVFSTLSGSWVFEQELNHSGWVSWDRFGESVSLSDGRLAAGAPEAYDGIGRRVGGIYVFDYIDLTGTWSSATRLNHANLTDRGRFGESVSLDGDWILGGAPQAVNSAGTQVGEAYLFRYDEISQSWAQVEVLNHSDQVNEDEFGYAVAFQADRALIGAPNITNSGGTRIGAGYFYQCYTLTHLPRPILAGGTATFFVDGGDPSTPTYLAYSLQGLGETVIDPLSLTLDLENPTQLGSTTVSDLQGNSSWVVVVPPAALGLPVWFQAAQFKRKTNLSATIIQ
ncbi:MAG: hypothetical protein DWQ01_10965 [Planctomycetota bacterium]|nr:MAG: hypothetical protein DWQ01_10965 [Planctomycetota bacterium]